MTELFFSLIFGGVVFLMTFAGIKIFRRWSLRRNLFDVPNERSSHTVPTPRGGGLVIVLVCLAGYAGLAIFRQASFRWSYLLGAFMIALVSWLDDLYTISFVWRFLIHTLGAVLIISTLGYFSELDVPCYGNITIGAAGIPLTLLWIVWLTNAYNFMDGIDGIAGIQAVTAGIGWLLIGNLMDSGGGFYGGVIAAAGFGFLIQNWQPAKIFMGDVGSAFLGYSFAVLPILLKNQSGGDAESGGKLLPCAVLLVWLFVFDTLWTFGRRVLNGERVWEAHRGHIYQRLIISGFSHRFVSGLYGLVSFLNVWLAILFLKNHIGTSVVLLLTTLQSAGLLIFLFFAGKRHSTVIKTSI